MTYLQIIEQIQNKSDVDKFGDIYKNFEENIFLLNKSELLEIILQLGTIPEKIRHDSSEEKLYSKVSDAILTRALQLLNIKANVNVGRANCADVIGKSMVHEYSLVADAKTFRLSRTAKNQKDFKINSLSGWRGESDYAVLVSPYYQYPKERSQIYNQALDANVCLFSWEHLFIILDNDLNDSVDLSQIWGISQVLRKKITVEKSYENFFEQFNSVFCGILKLKKSVFANYLKKFREKIIERGKSEIQFWESEKNRVSGLTREEAVRGLLSAMKVDEKIESIDKFVIALVDKHETE